jgi:hypothetical protein
MDVAAFLGLTCSCGEVHAAHDTPCKQFIDHALTRHADELDYHIGQGFASPSTGAAILGHITSGTPLPDGISIYWSFDKWFTVILTMKDHNSLECKELSFGKAIMSRWPAFL